VTEGATERGKVTDFPSRNTYADCFEDRGTIFRVSKDIYFLPVVRFGCETWSLTWREEHRLRVFENRVLRRIFRPKREEVTGDWRKLQNEDLHNLYSSPNIIRMIKSRNMRWAEYIARMGRRGVH
jgi:hypothetical protein